MRFLLSFVVVVSCILGSPSRAEEDLPKRVPLEIPDDVNEGMLMFGNFYFQLRLQETHTVERIHAHKGEVKYLTALVEHNEKLASKGFTTQSELNRTKLRLEIAKREYANSKDLRRALIHLQNENALQIRKALGEEIKLSEITLCNLENWKIREEIAKRKMKNFEEEQGLDELDLENMRALYSKGYKTLAQLEASEDALKDTEAKLNAAREQLEFTNTAMRLSRLAHRKALRKENGEPGDREEQNSKDEEKDK